MCAEQHKARTKGLTVAFYLEIRSPKCADEFAERLQILEDVTFNDYTPLNRDANMSPPTVIGLRVIANLKTASSTFRVGYKFSQSFGKCRPGYMSPSAEFPTTFADNTACVPCPLGQFASSDQNVYCVECPKGTYSNVTGAQRCRACPMGTSTLKRSSDHPDQCLPYCRAGSFSKTGLEPCTLCPRDTVQDKVGATFCDPCPINSFTLGASGLGYTSVHPWRCIDSTGIQFFIEKPRPTGQQITMAMTWKLPAEEVHVHDLVVLFKGDGWTSLRQLQWSYASAPSINGETACSGWVGDTCRQPGQSTKPWASITFQVDGAGAGAYSAIYFSFIKGIRMLSTSWTCPPEDCNFDLNQWETDTGLFVCKPGQFSKTGGSGPCIPCQPGTFSSRHASTNCTSCPQAFYSGSSNGGERFDTQPVGGQTAGLGVINTASVGAIVCTRCPAGTSSLKVGSVSEDCKQCDQLFLDYPGIEIAGCERRGQVILTTGQQQLIVTTPAPDVCGNGFMAGTETCDDGNRIQGDGCNSNCDIEPNWKCADEGTRCIDTCPTVQHAPHQHTYKHAVHTHACASFCLSESGRSQPFGLFAESCFFCKKGCLFQRKHRKLKDGGSTKIACSGVGHKLTVVETVVERTKIDMKI